MKDPSIFGAIVPTGESQEDSLPSSNTEAEGVPQGHYCEYVIGGVNHRSRPVPSDTVIRYEGTTDSYRSLFMFSKEIQDYYDNHNNSFKDYRGTLWAESLRMDFDTDEHLDHTKAEKVRTFSDVKSDVEGVIRRLMKEYGVLPDEMELYFSGCKGFHLEIPGDLFGGFAPSPFLEKIHAAIARTICKDVPSLDRGLYSQTRVFRLPNTINSKTGLHKVQLNIPAFMASESAAIKEVATSQQEVCKAVVEGPNAKLQELYQTAKREHLNYLNRTVIDYPDDEELDLEMVRKCSFMKHCEEKAASLSYYEWLAWMSNAARCKGGEDYIHKWSACYSDYDPAQTSTKIGEARKLKPFTHRTIAQVTGYKCDCEAAWTCPCHRGLPAKRSTRKRRYMENQAVDLFVDANPNLIYSTKSGFFYEYKEGTYETKEEVRMKQLLNTFLMKEFAGMDIWSSHIESLFRRLQTVASIAYNGRFNGHRFLVCLQNGVYDLQTGQLLEHSPDYHFTIKRDFEYDPEADCPLFKSVLYDILRPASREDVAETQEKADFILRWMCYTQIATYCYQKILVMLGEGRNGKGTLIHVWQRMLGNGNYAAIDLTTLAESRFMAIHLMDKLANFSGDLRTTDQTAVDQLKALSGEDETTADIKYRDPAKFRNIARLIAAANNVPRLTEINTAIRDRFQYIAFERKFIGADQDTGLEEKLMKELPGIFNLVVAYFPSIFQPDGSINIPYPACCEVFAKRSVMPEQSNVIEFACEAFEKVEGSHEGFAPAYQVYGRWTKYSGYERGKVGKSKFSKTLKEYGYKIGEMGHDNVVVIWDVHLKEAFKHEQDIYEAMASMR